MKRIIYTLFLALLFTSCEEFLEEKPTDLVSSATFYQTYDQCVVGVAAAYAEIRNNEGVVHFEDTKTDIDADGDDFNWLWTPASAPQAAYKEYYKVIAEANTTIEAVSGNAESIDNSLITSLASSSLKVSGLEGSKVIEGEARFIRALMYFNLVSYYGDVPLILQSFVSGDIPKDLVRTPKDSVYTQIRDDLKFAMANCATNEMVPAGRVTQAAAAGLLAKVDLYLAAITERDEKYWDRNLLPEAPSNKAALRAELYAEANDLCTKIIQGDLGSYQLEKYYPAAANGSLYSIEHLFAVHSIKGDNTNVGYHEGWHGGRGRRMTHYAQFLWDTPTWEDEWSSPKKIYDHGMALNDILVANQWSLTGDTTRRLWSCIVWRGNPDPPATVYWTVYEPLARFTGPEFFIEPGLGAAPYTNYSERAKAVLNDNNGDWSDKIWTATGRLLTDPEIWRINNAPSEHCSGKFRMKWPYPVDFNDGDYEHTYPVLRLAEIYLLRAEAKFFLANKVLTSDAIADLDVVRERAQNQAPLKELMLNHGAASNVIKTNSPKLFRDVLTGARAGNEGLKIILDERVRELSNENNIRWFDLVRFPEVIIPNIHEMSEQEQPLRAGIASGGNFYTTTYFVKDRFGLETDLHHLYLPMLESEIEFYPGLKQTYGYK